MSRHTDPLAINAVFVAKPGAEERILAALCDLLVPTRAEEGCLRYDLHRSEDDPAVFVMIEEWASRPLWERHMKSDHIKAWSEASDGLIADSSVYALRRIA